LNCTPKVNSNSWKYDGTQIPQRSQVFLPRVKYPETMEWSKVPGNSAKGLAPEVAGNWVLMRSNSRWAFIICGMCDHFPCSRKKTPAKPSSSLRAKMRPDFSDGCKFLWSINKLLRKFKNVLRGLWLERVAPPM